VRNYDHFDHFDNAGSKFEGRESARIARETRSDPRAEITFVRAFSAMLEETKLAPPYPNRDVEDTGRERQFNRLDFQAGRS